MNPGLAGPEWSVLEESRWLTPPVAEGDLAGRLAGSDAPPSRRVAERERAGHVPARVLRDAQDLEGLVVVERQSLRERRADALGTGGELRAPQRGVDRAAARVGAEPEEIERHQLEVISQPLGGLLDREHRLGFRRIG